MSLLYSIDVGASKIVVLYSSSEGNALLGNSVGFFNSEHEPLKGGVIADLQTVSKNLAKTLTQAQAQNKASGKIVANLAGPDLKNYYLEGDLHLAGKAVTQEVLNKLVKITLNQLNLSPAEQVLDYEVQEYLLDDDIFSINPLQFQAQNLKAHVNVFVAKKQNINNLQHAVNYSGFHLSKIIPSAILSALAVSSKDERKAGCCVLDIGSHSTDIAIYEGGFVRYVRSLQFGGEDLTYSIAKAFRISRNLAEDIKLRYGSCNLDGKLLEKIGLTEITDFSGKRVRVSGKILTDLAKSSMTSLLDNVLKILQQDNILDLMQNSGLILTGGAALLEGMEVLAAKKFNLNCRVGYPENLDLNLNSPRFATAAGGLVFARTLNTQAVNNRSWPASWQALKTAVRNLLK